MGLLGFVLPAAAVGLGSLLIRPQRGFLVPAGDGVGPPNFIVPQATIEEQGHDELEITDHPVEQNAAITDHAYKRPAEVIIRCAWSNSPSKPSGLLGKAVSIATTTIGGLAPVIPAVGPTFSAAQSLLSGNATGQVTDIYKRLLALQVQRVPFTVYTGKRKYDSMLIKSIAVSTDNRTENVLLLTISCRQVILVQVTTFDTTAPASQQAAPEKTAPPVDQGAKQTTPTTSFVADPGSFSASTATLQLGVDSVNQMFSQVAGGVGGLTGSAQGVLGNLPIALSSVTDTLSSITNGISLPSTIPFVDGAQSMTLSLGSVAATAQNSLASVLDGAPAILTSAQEVIKDTIVQLPNVELPPVFDSLSDALKGVSTQISNVVSKIPSVLSQVSSQVSGIVSSATNKLTFKWNDVAGSWLTDIHDATGNPVLTGIPLVPGSDLLGQFKHLGIGGGAQLITKLTGDPEAVPGFHDLPKNPLYVAGPQSVVF